MEAKEKFALVVFIFSLLALAVLVFALFQNKITGYAIETGELEETKSLKSSCSDSDGGKNYDIYGSVEYCVSENCEDKNDYCLNSMLNEAHCNGNEFKRAICFHS